MLHLLLFFFLLLGTSALPQKRPNPQDPPAIPSRKCGTGPPSDALVAAHADLHRENHLQRRKAQRGQAIVVDTYFHVVSTTDQAKAITPAMVANQYGTLQTFYANANISFNLLGTTYSVNDDWATDADDVGMKQALRQGGYATLNIYFQTNLSTTADGTTSQLLGYCALPTNVTFKACEECTPQAFPPEAYALDGCNVLAGSMPNGTVYGYSQGKTAVHEVGHWFGLLHTFQDNTCDSEDGGDFIDDTPQQSVSTSGCPVGKDSCPGREGLDLIHNLMDYSVDQCYESFTAGQMARMQDVWKTMRYGY
ncbi:hypothetical protein MMC24_007582 [Lignoscripta atroalba]|nr:hypothetical protein [Lignoscripta atroalba]